MSQTGGDGIEAADAWLATHDEQDQQRDDLDVRIVEAVASTLDKDPLDVPPLGHSIDVEAVATLANGQTAVSFEFEECEVFVANDDVSVSEL
jgi:hypothetical protein